MNKSTREVFVRQLLHIHTKAEAKCVILGCQHYGRKLSNSHSEDPSLHSITTTYNPSNSD